MKSILVLLVSASALWANGIIAVSPSTTTVGIGDFFSVDVTVDSDVTDLYAYQFSLSFDPTLLKAIGVTEGPLFANTGDSFFLPPTIDNTNGQIILTADTLLGPSTGVSGPGTLATFSFQAIQPGSSAIEFNPASDLMLFDSNLNLIDVTASSGDVNVQGGVAAPEPATWVLLALASGGFVLRRRR